MSESVRPRARGAAPDWTGALGYLACAALGWFCLRLARITGLVPSFEETFAMVIVALFLPLGVAGVWTSLIRSVRGRR